MSFPAASARIVASGSEEWLPTPAMLKEADKITPRKPRRDGASAKARHVHRGGHYRVCARGDACLERRLLRPLPLRLGFRISRNCHMRIAGRPAEPRKVLQRRPHSAVVESLHGGTDELCDRCGVGPERSVADHLVVGIGPYVGDRRQVEPDSELTQPYR